MMMEQELPALKQIGLIGDLPQGEQQALGTAACPRGSSMPGVAAKLGWIIMPRGSGIKALYIVAPFHEIEDKLVSGFKFENDSL
jgi:hypothetical protein